MFCSLMNFLDWVLPSFIIKNFIKQDYKVIVLDIYLSLVNNCLTLYLSCDLKKVAKTFITFRTVHQGNGCLLCSVYTY